MAWRKWLVRGVVYGIVAVCAAGGALYQRWTNPVAVREHVMGKLGYLFPGAQVSVDSARLRLLGGIQVNDLRLTRRDDPEQDEFLHVPSAVFYHDKEKLLEGELTIRKMELYRPRLRVRRGRDGHWNVQGLSRGLPPTGLLPTIVIHQGTVLFEDRSVGGKGPPLEIRDVEVTLINDPLPTVTIRGAAQSDVLGRLACQGAWQRPTNAVDLHLQALGVPINPTLVRRLAGVDVYRKLGDLVLQAKADLKGRVALRPGAAPFYDVECKVTDGKVQHPDLPLPLEGLAARARCCAGELRLLELTARSGFAQVRARGTGRLPALERNFEIHLDVKHLPLCEEMCARLPEKLRRLHQMYRPSGPATLQLSCARRDGEWAALADGSPPRISLRPEGLSIAFVRFPYPLERLTGTLDYNLLNRHTQVDVTGYAGDRPVVLRGHWRGEREQAEARLDLIATDVPIDEKLLQALPEKMQRVARSFRARGKLDLKAHISHDPGAPATEYRNAYHCRFHDAVIQWDDFPYPLENVSGVLNIYPKHWEFHEFQGTHRGGHVLLHGRSTPRRGPSGETTFGVFVEITGRNVALDGELHQALGRLPSLQKAWETFRPQGRLTFTASVNRPSPLPEELEVQVDARGCAVQPVFFPYLLHDLSGHFRFQNGRLTLTKLRGRHGEAALLADEGTAYLHKGGYWAELKNLHAERLRLDDDLIAALPRKLKTTAHALKLDGPLRLETHLVVRQLPEPGSSPDVYWDGTLALEGASLQTGFELSGVAGTLACRGLYSGQQLQGVEGNVLLREATAFKQPFRNVHAPFHVRKETPDVLLVGLRAPIFGGDLTGQVRLDLNSSLRYELDLTASQIDLQEFGRHNLPRSAISGVAVGRLHLTGQGNTLDSLDGNGTLDMPNGKLSQLPFLLDLLKFLGLHWPDRTLFEEMHAQFGIHGRRVNVRRMELLGNVVSLSGQGEFNLDGSDVQLDCVPTWGRFDQLLPPAIRPVPSAITRNFLTIEVRGKLGGGPNDLRFHKRLVPIVTEPLTALRNRVIRAAAPERRAP